MLTLWLIGIIGPPGVGKTCAGDGYVRRSPATRVRLSKDDARLELSFGGNADSNPPDVEEQVRARLLDGIRRELGAGRTVLVDGAFQWQGEVDDLVAVAAEAGAALAFWDFRTDDLGACGRNVARRVAAGGRFVDPAAIARVAGRCAGVVLPPGAFVVRCGPWSPKG